jgi:CelD/BcsL family acetyltransferase involved in cellulose biosynthesis
LFANIGLSRSSAGMNFALAATEHASLPRICLSFGVVVHLEITDRMERAESAWRQLSAPDNLVTAYQSFDFCALWLHHVGESAGMQPFIVIGRDTAGVPLFLWPLVRTKMGPLQVATYFCGRHANFRTTLWRTDIASSITAQDMRAIVAEISGYGIDALVLLNQPESWNGLPNPMQMLPSQPSPDETYGISLVGTGEEIIGRHLNRETRRKFRRKERHLADLPGLRYATASTPEAVDRYIAEFMKQKSARLSARGIKNAFSEPDMEIFLRAACRHGLADGTPLIEIHALDSDGEVLALYLALQDGVCFSAMFNSYTLSEHSRRSPGFNLLLRIVENCAKRGFKSLNLGIGAAAYKSSLCDLKGHQFDTFVALTMRGRLFTLLLSVSYRMKGAIKRNPTIWNFVQSLRAKRFARSSPAD